MKSKIKRLHLKFDLKRPDAERETVPEKDWCPFSF